MKYLFSRSTTHNNFNSKSRCITEYRNHYSKLCSNLQGENTIQYYKEFPYSHGWVLSVLSTLQFEFWKSYLYYLKEFFETYKKFHKLYML